MNTMNNAEYIQPIYGHEDEERTRYEVIRCGYVKDIVNFEAVLGVKTYAVVIVPLVWYH